VTVGGLGAQLASRIGITSLLKEMPWIASGSLLSVLDGAAVTTDDGPVTVSATVDSVPAFAASPLGSPDEQAISTIAPAASAWAPIHGLRRV